MLFYSKEASIDVLVCSKWKKISLTLTEVPSRVQINWVGHDRRHQFTSMPVKGLTRQNGKWACVRCQLFPSDKQLLSTAKVKRRIRGIGMLNIRIVMENDKMTGIACYPETHVSSWQPEESHSPLARVPHCNTPWNRWVCGLASSQRFAGKVWTRHGYWTLDIEANGRMRRSNRGWSRLITERLELFFTTPVAVSVQRISTP